jgi:hypothetical protein
MKTIPENEFKKKITEDTSPAMEAARNIALVIKSLPPLPDAPDVPPLAYVVGGYVRDTLLGKTPKDVDVQVYGVLPDDLEVVINTLFPGCVQKVGKSFEILKVCLSDGTEIDVTISRPIPAAGQEKFECGDPLVTPRLGGKLRDFTINNFAVDPLTGELFDWFGGRDDLEKGIVRIMTDDVILYRPVNAYRGIQFASRMELKPDERYYEVMREVISSGAVQKIHPRVVRQEWNKLVVKGSKPSIGFQIGRSIGLFQSEFPGFVEALDASNNWEKLCSMLDLVHERKILSSIHEDRHFVFITSLILYVLPEDTREEVGTTFLNRIAVRGGFARIAYSLLEGLSMLGLLVHDLARMEKESEEAKSPPSRKKLPGLRLSPGVPRAESISPCERKKIRIQEFLKYIAPYTWDEFCVFSDFVGAEKNREIEYVGREIKRVLGRGYPQMDTDGHR